MGLAAGARASVPALAELGRGTRHPARVQLKKSPKITTYRKVWVNFDAEVQE